MKFLINFSRLFVGVLFIFSGLVKANDPLGLSYKMQEFFELWGMEMFNDYTLIFSIVMIAFEIIAGVAILLGWQMKLFSWLLLLLIVFFTFLTGYAVITGKPKECGCFGNCIPLTAQQSFYKDLILLALIIFLFIYKDRIKPLFGGKVNFVTLFFSGIFSVALMWFALQHLPPIDCLPYQKGKSIVKEMKLPEGAIPDSTVISFVYVKQGKEVEFTANSFPEDFNDTLYTFKRRYDKLIRKGNMEPAIKDFTLSNEAGTLVTDSILNAPGKKLLLFVRHGIEKGEWSTYAETVLQESKRRGVSVLLVTSMSKEELVKQFGFLTTVPFFACDATAIKTAARSNPTLYLLENDIIVDKWGQADFDVALKFILSTQQ